MRPAAAMGGEDAELSRPYWAALRMGDFVLQRCRSCARWQHYPRLLCRWCGSTDLTWSHASRTGTVVTAVLAHHTSRAEFRRRLPYAIALVRTTEGPLVLAATAGGAALPAPGTGVVIDLAGTLDAGVLVIAASQEGRP